MATKAGEEGDDFGSAVVPTFRYHPDPVVTGSVEESDEPCAVCGRERGYLYAGPFFSEATDEPRICPWCIADGSAAAELDGDFTDVGDESPPEVPLEVLDELRARTPGFTGWQQERWLYHCHDACAFLGRPGLDDLAINSDVLEALRRGLDEFEWTDEEVTAHIESLGPDSEPTPYLFSCLHCGAFVAYWDSP
jgi:uncharacterized protein CbrC (UPF0167 family)